MKLDVDHYSQATIGSEVDLATAHQSYVIGTLRQIFAGPDQRCISESSVVDLIQWVDRCTAQDLQGRRPQAIVREYCENRGLPPMHVEMTGPRRKADAIERWVPRAFDQVFPVTRDSCLRVLTWGGQHPLTPVDAASLHITTNLINTGIRQSFAREGIRYPRTIELTTCNLGEAAEIYEIHNQLPAIRKRILHTLVPEAF